MERRSSAPRAIRLFTFFLACLLLLLTVGATPVHKCDRQADYAVKASGVEISPNPVLRGKPATFSIFATTENSITGGKLVIDVKYFGVHIHQETHEVCDETSCPVTGGDFVISHYQVLPSFTPPGSYTLMMKMFGEAGNLLTCITFDFKIRVGSPAADS